MQKRFKHFIRDQPMLRAGALRVGSLLRSLDRASPGLYTLVYHHVPAAAQNRFDRQLSFLKGFGTFIGPDEAAARVEKGWSGTDRAFLLSFDDGQADNVDVALPVLRQHRIPAIQFLVSDWLTAPPDRSDRKDGFMTEKDVATWLDAGLSIGSHTAGHRQISKLDAAGVRSEMERSRDRLATVTGAPVSHFACPWGVAVSDYDPLRDPALAQECGYRTFFTTRRGRATRQEDLMAMPRHVLEPHWSLHELHALLGEWRANA